METLSNLNWTDCIDNVLVLYWFVYQIGSADRTMELCSDVYPLNLYWTDCIDNVLVLCWFVFLIDSADRMMERYLSIYLADSAD